MCSNGGVRTVPVQLVMCAVVAVGPAGCRLLAAAGQDLACVDVSDCAVGQRCAGEPSRCVAGAAGDDGSTPVADAGPPVDGGAPADAGAHPADAGAIEDAGIVSDAGAADAGHPDGGLPDEDAGAGCFSIGHDEDGDAFDDACDACPQRFDSQGDELEAANGEQPDGVGDACDPNPTIGGDRLVFFDGFGGALASGWISTSGTWIVENDGLRQTELVGSHSMTRNDVAVQDVFVESSLVFDTFGVDDPSAGVLGRYDDGDAYACLLFDTPAPTQATGGAIYLNRLINGGGDPQAWESAPQPQVGVAVRVRMRAADATLVCQSDGSGSAAVADAVVSSGTIGMRVNRASVHYEWIAAYATAEPPSN